MSWIRLNSDLPGSPRILQLARAMKKDEVYALGAAATWFCWLDKNSADGTTGLTPKELDAMALHCKGLAHALLENGWAVLDAQGFVCAVDFTQYNGESAKKRALTARRVERSRADVTQGALQDGDFGNAGSVTDALPREDNIYIKKGAGKAEVCSERGAQVPAQGAPAPTPDFPQGWESCKWMQAMKAAHPGCARSMTLADDVLTAAWAAYRAFPAADEHAELLGAFFRAKVDFVGEKERFYRPRGQRRFFEDLADVVEHALSWAKFSGWTAKKRAARRPEERQPAAPEAEPMSDEQRAQMLREISALKSGERKGGAQ